MGVCNFVAKEELLRLLLIDRGRRNLAQLINVLFNLLTPSEDVTNFSVPIIIRKMAFHKN